MPESVARKISLSFIPSIFAEGHIMNSPFVAIIPLYAVVVRRMVIWSRYWFADFTSWGWSVYYHTYVAVCVVTHNGMDPGAAFVICPLL